jgi:hypothetical protein
MWFVKPKEVIGPWQPLDFNNTMVVRRQRVNEHELARLKQEQIKVTLCVAQPLISFKSAPGA